MSSQENNIDIQPEADDQIVVSDTEIEEDQTIDEEDEENTLTAYDIAVFYNTYNLATLMKWWGTKLIVPSFQRSFVWTHKQASEFVDSILRGLPVPAIFLYDDKENSRYLVVDGQQRLKSLHAYIYDGKYAEKKFRLNGNIHPKWNNLSYDELEQDERDRLDDALINTTLMRQLSPNDGSSSMYLAFQRINTGGISLKAQEIRMALAYGPFADYLHNLSQDKRFDKWYFLRTKKQRANNDYAPIQEFILRFWTYYFTYPSFSGSSTRAMLDNFIEQNKDFDIKPKPGVISHSKSEFTEAFEAAFEIVNNLPIDVITPYKRPTQSFLETIWVGLTYRVLKTHKEINADSLVQHIKNWKSSVGDSIFSELFQARRSSSAKSVSNRIQAGIEYFSEDF